MKCKRLVTVSQNVNLKAIVLYVVIVRIRRICESSPICNYNLMYHFIFPEERNKLIPFINQRDHVKFLAHSNELRKVSH